MKGQTISHYRILEKLGEGGMGEVYQAEDTKLKRTVALKFLPPDLTRDNEARERFVQEAQAASALSHANICGIHAIEVHEGRQFIDMEFLEGKTLGAVLKEKELSLKEISAIAVQVADGLHAAHKKGIVHRDIKPDNIMITAEGQVKIMDFGLAKWKGSAKLTQAHSTLGTLCYMSPEQARGEEVDRRSDIFSLGAVLYEMIAGRRPFKDEYEAAIIYSILNETPEPLARYKAGIPDGMQRIVDKALTKEREKRYQHADEMAADLRAAAEKAPGGGPARRKSKLPWAVAAGTLVLAVILSYLFFIRPTPRPAIGKSVAVLPFKNLSDSKEDEYFSDGLTEDIITQLSKISGIEKVIARTSMMRYKGSDKGIRQVGQELGVATVLEGSVRRSGNQLRIVAQLIDAGSEGHLWAETYDQEMTQIFAVQSEVAQRIAEALKARLTPGEKQKIEKSQTGNTEAYQLYLKGRFCWKKRTREGFERAIQFFHKAIESDPSYALAYSGLADAYITQSAYFFIPPKEADSKARAAALKAQALDPSLAEPHSALAGLFEFERDWAKAEKEHQRALELNPNYSTGRHWYGEFLAEIGRFDEALKELKKAQELDPLSPILYASKASVLAGMRRYDEGIEQIMKALEIDANFPRAHSLLGLLYFLKGNGGDAIRAHQKAVELSGSSMEHVAYLGWTYGRLGQKEEAGEILREFLRLGKQQHVSPFLIGALYLSLGEDDRAFSWLHKSIEEHEQAMLSMKYDPTLDPIRKDPRFSELLKKMRLPL